MSRFNKYSTPMTQSPATKWMRLWGDVLDPESYLQDCKVIVIIVFIFLLFFFIFPLLSSFTLPIFFFLFLLFLLLFLFFFPLAFRVAVCRPEDDLGVNFLIYMQTGTQSHHFLMRIDIFTVSWPPEFFGKSLFSHVFKSSGASFILIHVCRDL